MCSTWAHHSTSKPVRFIMVRECVSHAAVVSTRHAVMGLERCGCFDVAGLEVRWWQVRIILKLWFCPPLPVSLSVSLRLSTLVMIAMALFRFASIISGQLCAHSQHFLLLLKVSFNICVYYSKPVSTLVCGGVYTCTVIMTGEEWMPKMYYVDQIPTAFKTRIVLINTSLYF